jgi:CheY-like chemotaxis protein
MANQFKFPGKMILVAEDNLDNQELMKDMLEELQCQVDIAKDGEEAIEKYKKKYYDLLILDIHMPKKNGYQTALEIRRLEKRGDHIPILALTADVIWSNQIMCKEAEMDDYISKPIDIDLLEQKLNEIFSKA